MSCNIDYIIHSLYLWREDWNFELRNLQVEIAVGDCLFSPRHPPDVSSRYTMASFSSGPVKNEASTRHQSMYKQGVGKHVESSKERRRQATVQIRRSKKQKAIMAKRMKYSSTLSSNDSMASIDMTSTEGNEHNRDGSVTEVVNRLSAADTVAKATSALKALRKKLSTKSTENPGTNALSPILSDFSKTQGGTDILMKYLQQATTNSSWKPHGALQTLLGEITQLPRPSCLQSHILLHF